MNLLRRLSASGADDAEKWHRHRNNPRGLTRAQWTAALAARARMLEAAESTERTAWPHERVGRHPAAPPVLTRDEIAAQLNRDLIRAAARGR